MNVASVLLYRLWATGTNKQSPCLKEDMVGLFSNFEDFTNWFQYLLGQFARPLMTHPYLIGMAKDLKAVQLVEKDPAKLS